MSQSNPTRKLLLEALEAAKLHACDPAKRDSARSVLAFVCGYCERAEPEISKAIDELLSFDRRDEEARDLA